MKKVIILLLVVPLLTAASVHKYYLSVTDLTYDEEAQSIQIITRMFYDDLEKVLQERYDTDILVDATSDQDKLDMYLKKYLSKKIDITVDGTSRELLFIGKEYEDDYVVIYTEVADIESISLFEIENTLLMDLFPEQKNMVHTLINGKKKSFLLTTGNAKGLLNF